MGAERLELHFAFRKAVADRPQVWGAVQVSPCDFHARRVRCATMLRSVAWLSLGTMLIGTLLLFSPLAPAWLDARLYILFLVFGWALAELWQQARRRRPWLLPALSPRALPGTAREFLESCRGRAVWWDRRERSRPIRASDLEPAEALMILSDDADIRDQALPNPKDMDEPVAILVVPSEPSLAYEERRAQAERTPEN